jgi:ParB/RepB/Spo0J family partition protein
MSEKPKPKASTRDVIRNAVQRRREPPSDLQSAPSGGLIQSLHGPEPVQVNDLAVQPVAEQGDQGAFTTVKIASIRPGKYQKREKRNEESFQQLKDQIQDLGFRFIAMLCRDPDDPTYYNPMMGGHLRLEAAKELGIEEVPAIIYDYDDLAMAKGTYYENNGRQQLTPIEEGQIFKQCMKNHNWVQEEVADHLAVPGGRKYVSFCVTAANADPDIQEVLRKEPGKGRRCFSYLLRLDELGQERAVKLRKPIIEDFLKGSISTDAVEIRVKHILERERNLEVKDQEQEHAGNDIESLEDIKLRSKILTAERSIDGIEKKIGGSVPSLPVRESLLRLKAKIDNLLER